MGTKNSASAASLPAVDQLLQWRDSTFALVAAETRAASPVPERTATWRVDVPELRRRDRCIFRRSVVVTAMLVFQLDTNPQRRDLGNAARHELIKFPIEIGLRETRFDHVIVRAAADRRHDGLLAGVGASA